MCGVPKVLFNLQNEPLALTVTDRYIKIRAITAEGMDTSANIVSHTCGELGHISPVCKRIEKPGNLVT